MTPTAPDPVTPHFVDRGGERPNLLFLCQSVPFPVDSGAHIRSYHTLRLLASAFQVQGIFFLRRSTRPDPRAGEAAREGLSPYCEPYIFPVPQDRSRIRYFWDHLRSVLSRRVYTEFAYDAPEARARIGEILSKGGIDLIHLDSVELYSLVISVLEALPNSPHPTPSDHPPAAPPNRPVLICSHHNVESVLLRSRSRLEKRTPVRAYIGQQAAWMEQLEKKALPDVDLNLAVSEVDREAFLDLAPEARVQILPNAVDTQSLQPRGIGGEREGTLFIGGASWFPNADAMDFFARQILPLIRQTRPDYPARWLAREDEGTCTSLARRLGMEVLGWVERVEPYVDRAACYVVPLRAGSGTRLKIIEAWALGAPVVSTTLGAQGLKAVHGENILLADTPEEFAKEVLKVVESPRLQEALGRKGRMTAESLYDWNSYRNGLVTAYTTLLPDP